MNNTVPNNQNRKRVLCETIDDFKRLKFARALGRLAAEKKMDRYNRNEQARNIVIPAFGERSYQQQFEEGAALLEEETVTEGAKELLNGFLSSIRDSVPADLLLVQFRNTCIGAEKFDVGDKIIEEYGMPALSKVLDGETDKLTVAAVSPSDNYFEWYWKEGRYVEKSLRHLMRDGLIFRQIVSVDSNGRGRKPADIDVGYLFDCSRRMGRGGQYFRLSQAHNLAAALTESLENNKK